MGLDMYAFTTMETLPVPVDFDVNDAAELHYWRKHPNLHGWMFLLYEEKNGQDPDFNCVNLKLTAADLDRLEIDVKAGALPHTSGFFFGASRPDERDLDLEFIRKARIAMSHGQTVFYSSWW